MEKGGLKVVFGSEDAHFSEIKKNGKRYVLSLYFRIHVLVRHLPRNGGRPLSSLPIMPPSRVDNCEEDGRRRRKRGQDWNVRRFEHHHLLKKNPPGRMQYGLIPSSLSF